MVERIDIVRAAALVRRQHGAGAITWCNARRAALVAAGDVAGAAAWSDIAAAVLALQMADEVEPAERPS